MNVSAAILASSRKERALSFDATMTAFDTFMAEQWMFTSRHLFVDVHEPNALGDFWKYVADGWVVHRKAHQGLPANLEYAIHTLNSEWAYFGQDDMPLRYRVDMQHIRDLTTVAVEGVPVGIISLRTVGVGGLGEMIPMSDDVAAFMAAPDDDPKKALGWIHFGGCFIKLEILRHVFYKARTASHKTLSFAFTKVFFDERMDKKHSKICVLTREGQKLVEHLGPTHPARMLQFS